MRRDLGSEGANRRRGGGGVGWGGLCCVVLCVLVWFLRFSFGWSFYGCTSLTYALIYGKQ